MRIVVDQERSYRWRAGACVLLTTYSMYIGGIGGAYVLLASWSRRATEDICYWSMCAVRLYAGGRCVMDDHPHGGPCCRV